VVAVNAWLSRWVPACVIYCAIAAARVHRQAGYVPRSEQVIQNGCDTTVFKRSVSRREALRQQWGTVEGTLVIGHAGRWDAQKDYSTLVIAMDKIAAVFPEANFVLVGPGIDEQNRELVCLLREAGLQRVRLLGVSNDMVAFYSALDCLIMSSAYGEGFPNVLVEAMACEVPCVATDVGDSGFIVGGTGRVVPVGSPDELASAVLDIIKMVPETRRALGVAARGRIVEHFSFERMVDQYEAVYAGLVKQGQY
jgi:glycosyltransferase involved in cell wall biosynthesis